MDELSARTDAVIAAIAARQHGVVSWAQLRTAGISKDSVWKAVRAGRLHRIYRGVYAVGHRGLSNEGWWMAAVLACGEGAVLSHRSAAHLWRILELGLKEIDVTVPTANGRRRRKGIRLHRCPSLPKDATTDHDGIAVTTPARTLTDLKRVVSPGLHRKATRQAEFLKLDLGAIVTDHTRSEPERRFLLLCSSQRIPPPEVNQQIGPYTVDFLWRDECLVVEVDGYGSHRGRQAFEDDHGRDLYLHASGYAIRRFTVRQIDDRPGDVAKAVQQALALCSSQRRTKRHTPG